MSDDCQFFEFTSKILMLKGYREEIEDYIGDGNRDRAEYKSPNTVKLRIENNNKIYSYEFTFPIKYPQIPPTVHLDKPKKDKKDYSKVSIDYDTCRKFLLQSKNTQYFSTIANEINYQLNESQRTLESPDHIPDSFETMKLLVQSRLSELYRKQWIDESISYDMPSHYNIVEFQPQFLIYALYSALGGEKSITQCRDFLEKKFGVTFEHNLTPDQIKSSVEKAFENTQIPSSIRDHFLVQHSHAGGKNIKELLSRFFDDFSVVFSWGQGYVKASNRIDRRVYTVQCMKISQDIPATIDKLNNILKKLTSLQHRYLVRYYNSWVETCSGELAKVIKDDFRIDMVKARKLEDIHREERIDFSQFNKEEEENEESESAENQKQNDDKQPKEEPLETFYFIQMEYCHHISLAEVLQDPSQMDQQKQWDITRQILEILHYIHSNGITHNNLTPDAIYIDENNNIKLGGFGPETIDCTNNDILVTKKDMLAFASIFFQIFYPKNNKISYTDAFNDIRAGKMPPHWADAFPIQAKIVSLLVQPPAICPSAIDLLQAKLIPTDPKSSNNKDLSKFMSILNAGQQNLGKLAYEVIHAFFSDSRRLPFRLSDFEESPTKQSALHDCRAAVLKAWYEICMRNNALYFNTPFIRNVSGKPSPNSVTLMLPDGRLLDLRSNMAQTIGLWIQQNSVRSIRLFSCMLVFSWEQSDKHSQVDEEENLSYSIITPSYSIENYIECAMTAIILIHRFIDLPIKALIYYKEISQFVEQNNLHGRSADSILLKMENSDDEAAKKAAYDVRLFLSSCEIKSWDILIQPQHSTSVHIYIIANNNKIAKIFQMHDKSLAATITSSHMRINKVLDIIGSQKRRLVVQLTTENMTKLPREKCIEEYAVLRPLMRKLQGSGFIVRITDEKLKESSYCLVVVSYNETLRQREFSVQAKESVQAEAVEKIHNAIGELMAMKNDHK